MSAREEGQSALLGPSRRVLIIGTLISFLLMIIGLSYAVVVGTRDESVDIPGLLNSLLSLKPGGIVGLGIVVMLLTPVLNVLALGVIFARLRDRWFTLVALLVLVIMAANALLSGR